MLFVCLTRNSSNTKTQNVERQLRKIQEHTEHLNLVYVEKEGYCLCHLLEKTNSSGEKNILRTKNMN